MTLEKTQPAYMSKKKKPEHEKVNMAGICKVVVYRRIQNIYYHPFEQHVRLIRFHKVLNIHTKRHVWQNGSLVLFMTIGTTA